MLFDYTKSMEASVEKEINEEVGRAITDTLQDDDYIEAKQKYGNLDNCHMNVIANRQLENMFKEILRLKRAVEKNYNCISFMEGMMRSDNSRINCNIDSLTGTVAVLTEVVEDLGMRLDAYFKYLDR